MTYYCWHCYGKNPRGSGPCVHCGREVAPPEETSFDDQLIWALRHPLPARQLAAAHAIGERRVEKAIAPLRELVEDSDPYLAAAALEALVAITGPEKQRGLLEELRRTGSPSVRRVAGRLF